MYITPRLRLLAAVDPKALERERQDINKHQSQSRAASRLSSQLDTARARLEVMERRFNQNPTDYNLRAVRNQEHRLAFFERAAALQGITKGKDIKH